MATKNQFSAIATTENIMHARDELRKELQDEVKELVESQERPVECIWASQIDTQKKSNRTPRNSDSNEKAAK